MKNESALLHAIFIVALWCLGLLIAIVIAWEPLAARWPAVFGI